MSDLPPGDQPPHLPKPTENTYLGDSVYASFDGFVIRIFTENSLGKRNVIFMEPEVFRAFVAWGTTKLTESPPPPLTGADF